MSAIEGLTMSRTPILSVLTADYEWPRKLLTAVDSAIALGVPRFELELRREIRDVPVFRTVRGMWGEVIANEQDGTRGEPTQRLIVYALRIDDASEP